MAQLPISSPTLKDLLKSVYPAITFLQSIRPPSPAKVFRPVLFLVIMLSIAFIAFYYYVLIDLPSPASLSTRSVPLTTHIRDRNGRELYKIYASQNRTLVKISDLPSFVTHATLAIEDKDFYTHHGYSTKGVLRALWRIITNRRLEGGSTITQQLVKTSLLSPERTLRRKLRELILAISVEAKYPKEQILEMYLNRVSYGGSSYGIEEAAQTYFGKSSKDLDLAQSAFLAGLPAAPTTYSPFGAHPELAKDRQAQVLSQMATAGFITWEQAKVASSQNLNFKPPATQIAAPHFVMYVRELLAQKYGPDVVEQGGLDVITSLDLDLQETTQKIVAQETAKIAHLHIKNGATLITNPKTGEILAMVGSRDYFDIKNDGNVNVTIRPRQPGSSIKPINYALALLKNFTPASIIDDSPVTYNLPGLPPYSPVNYDHRYHGRVSLRTALGSSYNVPAVKLLAANGVENMVALARNMGITTWEDPSRFGLSLTLGGGEVTMTDMAVVYGVFANLGKRVDLHPILSVRDSRGRTLEEFDCVSQSNNPSSSLLAAQAAESAAAATEIIPCPATEVLSPQVAFLITDILADNSARAPTFGSNSQLYFPKNQVAVKTGTTNNLRDNWTIGYTPNILVSVWVGNNDNSPMSYVASGVTGASPIWRRVMTHLLSQYPSLAFTPPNGLQKVAICPSTGQMGCDSCPGKAEYFIVGTEPKSRCTARSFPNPTPSQDKILNGASTQSLLPTPKPRRPSPIPRNRR